MLRQVVIMCDLYDRKNNEGKEAYITNIIKRSVKIDEIREKLNILPAKK